MTNQEQSPAALPPEDDDVYWRVPWGSLRPQLRLALLRSQLLSALVQQFPEAWRRPVTRVPHNRSTFGFLDL